MEDIKLNQYTLRGNWTESDGTKHRNGAILSLTAEQASQLVNKVTLVGGNIPADYGAKNDEIAGLLIKVEELTNRNEVLENESGELKDTINLQGNTISTMLKEKADADKAAKAEEKAEKVK